jgi:hypothetical protein
MADFVRSLGNFRIDNLADYGVLADTIEVFVAVFMIVGGIFITHLIQKWADQLGEQPPAANRGEGGGADRYEQHGMRG